MPIPSRAVADAVDDVKYNVPHSEKRYVFICDYSQNMEAPFLGFTQPGDTYYLTPYSVYCFGMVNAAHLYDQGIHENQLGDHMHAHVYEEKTGSKGANNVASLIMKTLGELGFLTDGQKGKKLSIFLTTAVAKIKTIQFY